jgi:hypothetical protein
MCLLRGLRCCVTMVRCHSMVIGSALRAHLQSEPRVCVAFEKYVECVLLLKVPAAQGRRLERRGGRLQATVIPLADPPSAMIRLDWHFPRGTSEDVRAIDRMAPTPLDGWFLRRLLTQGRVEVTLLDEELQVGESLRVEWHEKRPRGDGRGVRECIGQATKSAS